MVVAFNSGGHDRGLIFAVADFLKILFISVSIGLSTG